MITSVLSKTFTNTIALLLLLASSMVFAEWDFRGTPNDWESEPMLDLGEGIFGIEVSFEKQDENARFKIDRFGDWSESYPAQDYIVDDCASYEITFDSEEKLIGIEKLADITTGACENTDTWYVRSSASLWESVEMTWIAGTNEYQLEVAFEKQEETPRFKIDHFDDWSESYPAQDFVVEDCTLYNILFNAEDKTIEVEALETITTGVCETTPDAWFFRGTANAWEADPMTALESGVEYEITIGFEKEEEIARFKIDHFADWVEAYPAEDYVVEECSEYHILFNSEDFTITTTKLSDIVTGDCEPQPTVEWFFRGTPNDWETTQLTQVEDSVLYEAVVSFKKEEEYARFKIDRFGDWHENYPSSDYIVDDCAEYHIQFNIETQEIFVEKLADIVGGACNQAENTVAGDLRIFSMNIDEIDGRTRTIRVLLPQDYDSSEASYPTLYMFDGQNSFDQSTSSFGQEWGIDETLAALTESGLNPGVIVVAIDSAETELESYREYTNWDWTHPSAGDVDAIGDQYSDFVVNSLIPTINNRYRTLADRDNTAIAGSALGGYMSIFTAMRHQDVFSKIASLSTIALDEPMAGFNLRAFVEGADAEFATRVYLDVGTNESVSYVSDPSILVNSTYDMCNSFQSTGFEDIMCHSIEGGTHDETSWGSRFEEVFGYLFETVDVE